MNFSRTLLAAAVAAAASSSASAVTLNVSGATAQENMLVLAAVDHCTVTPITVRSSGNFRQITCGTTTVNKAGAGGSGNGVGPVFNATSVQFVTNWGACATTVSTTSTLKSGVKTYNTLTGCPITTGQIVPDAGLSDVEPALFGVTNLNGGSSVGTSLLSFGIIASQTLRTALQAAQGLNCDLNGNGTITTNERNAEACMPTMSTAEVASIFAGNLGNASALQAAPAAGPIDVAFRVSTSGTQKISEVVFLNQGCTGNISVVQNAGTNSFGGVVTELSGSGDVRNSVTASNTAGRYAIGVLSTESAPTAAWGYVKIDGVSPSIENVINGSYDYVSFNAANASAALLADTSGKLTAWNALVAGLSDANAITAANAAFGTAAFGGVQGGFIGGYAAVFASATPVARPASKAAAIANPVSTQSKDGFGGGVLNNCGSVQIF